MKSKFICNIAFLTLAVGCAFYIVKFDSLHKLPGIDSLADQLIKYPFMEAATLGLLLGVWVSICFLFIWGHFFLLHKDEKIIPLTVADIHAAAGRKISALNLVIYPATAGAACFTGAIGLIGLIQLNLNFVFPNVVFKNFAELYTGLINVAVVSPLAETAVAVVLIELGKRWIKNRMLILTLSALIWGALHATLAPINFFATSWIFLVLTDLYLVLREKTSISMSATFMCAAHFLNNLLAFGVVLIRS